MNIRRVEKLNAALIETLEQRRLLAADVGITDGVLVITGTSKDDRIVLSTNETGSAIHVLANGRSFSFNAESIARIVVSARGGDDLIAVAKDSRTVLQTPMRVDAGIGDDRVRTAAGNDTIHGGGGSDSMHARGGNDIIHIGGGWTELIVDAGAGDDVIYDGDYEELDVPRTSRIYGAAGNDTFYAKKTGSGFSGGTGDDTMHGGEGSDHFSGMAGNDVVYGNGGDDHLFGDADNDLLDAGDGSDRLFGGEGDDTVNGDWDTDTVIEP